MGYDINVLSVYLKKKILWVMKSVKNTIADMQEKVGWG